MLKCENNKKYDNIFFVLKMLTILFCTTPIFYYRYNENVISAWGQLNIIKPIILLVVIIIVVFMWVVLDFNLYKKRVYVYIEMLVCYLMCLFSITCSGMHASYSKYIFIPIIAVYTMEISYNMGTLIATISSATILFMDVVFYKNGGTNLYFQSDISLCMVFYIIAWVIGYYVKIEKEHIKELENRINMDLLTGTYNHRYFYNVLEELMKNDPECKKDLSVIMIDIDYFKSINDTYGHQAGDDILRKVAYIIKDSSREEDIICRYGGDEFSIVYPNTTQEQATVFANNLREKVCSYNFENNGLYNFKTITISIGVAERKNKHITTKMLIDRADTALYRAKFLSKNRVELYSSIFSKFSNADAGNTTDGSDITSVKALITIINSRDNYTYNHTKRVVSYCQVYSEYFSLTKKEKKLLVYGAYLHDVGKINISKEVLISDKKLSEDDWKEIKMHPVYGADIVSHMRGLDEDLVYIVKQHHERFNGTGYPDGLKGNEIHKLARILSIADSFDAMTADRPYQKQKTFDEAFKELTNFKGTQFDPDYVDKFIEALNNRMNR